LPPETAGNSSISVSIRQHRRGQELNQPHVVFSWCSCF
jgi:hypothetical protein